MASGKTIFVENLSLRVLLLVALSWFWNWLKEGSSGSRVYYFAGSASGKTCARYLNRLGLVEVMEADYSWVEIRNIDDELCYLRVLTRDAPSLWQSARGRELEGNTFLTRLSRKFDRDRLLLYIAKCVDEEIRWKLFRINVIEWFRRHNGLDETDPLVYYSPRSRWSEYLEKYAADHGICIRWYRCFPSWLKTCQAWARLVLGGVRYQLKWFVRARESGLETIGSVNTALRNNKSDRLDPLPEVAVLYTGRELAFDPMRHSDVFWLPYSVYANNGILIYSTRSNGRMPFRRVSMKQLAPDFDEKSVWSPWTDWETLRSWWRLESWTISQWLLSLTRHPRRPVWLLTKLSTFVIKYVYWHGFFRKFGVRLHVSHGDWHTERVAADQALADLGGLSVSYQTSHEPLATTFRASAVDVHFGFALSSADSELRSDSKISQFVVAGYIHDHAFLHVRRSASQVRSKLQRAGAEFIICFLDENSVDDKRHNISHEHAGENYKYILTKVLVDPTLGLVLKPKKPNTLRRRLGHLSALLDKVLATGRCYLFDEGQTASSVLPCEGCLAADLAIGLLFGGTAAMESALAGTPTLLIDRERLIGHPLYKLGKGRVVFQDWDSLWQALSVYRKDPAAVAGLGNWSSMLDELDSFRDGRAAERMGSYIGWLAEGISKGLSREETMELARQRYVEVWGNDKVIQLKDSHDRSWDVIGLHGQQSA